MSIRIKMNVTRRGSNDGMCIKVFEAGHVYDTSAEDETYIGDTMARAFLNQGIAKQLNLRTPTNPQTYDDIGEPLIVEVPCTDPTFQAGEVHGAIGLKNYLLANVNDVDFQKKLFTAWTRYLHILDAKISKEKSA